MIRIIFEKLCATCYNLTRYDNNRQLVIFMNPTILVANTVLNDAFNKGYSVTPMKLQKLVYFVYKKYLQDNNRPLFDEPFEVWEHGPVAPSIYQAFKGFSKKVISEYYRQDGSIFIVSPTNAEFYSALEFVLAAYKDWNGKELSDATHMKGGAWQKALDRKERYLLAEDITNEGWIIHKELVANG